MKRSETQRSYNLTLIGVSRRPFDDAYHFFLRAPWRHVLGLTVLVHLVINLLFALAFRASGGVANINEAWGFFSYFFFSVETFATIGYGTQYPLSQTAHVLVTVESVVSLLFSALMTGMLFAKFSRPWGRMVFADRAVITLFHGKPTLMLRIGNERGNRVVEASIHVDLARTERHEDGSIFYRQHELKLSRSRIVALSRSWNVIHVIEEDSPLFGQTPEMLTADEVELSVSVTGIDDTSGQTMHGQTVYEAHEIVFGAKLADILTEDNQGNVIVDLSKFDDIVPQEPSDAVPYRAAIPPRR